MKNSQSIFISYRRENGFETANLIYDRLIRAGYKVFLDCESLRSGKFNEQLYKQIENCKDFLVILPPNSLDRCETEGDWLRLEITHALKHKKNIVPVMLRNFTFPDELPDDINELRNYQGIEASQELFNAFIEKLKSLLISKKHLTWQRAKKYVLFILIPLLIAIGVLSYFQIQKNINEEKEHAQLEQICREEISLMGMEFVKMNNSIIAIEDANSEWEKFRAKISKANPDEKNRIRNEFINYINFKKTQIDTSKPTWKLSTLYENILTKNGIKTEELRVFFSVNHLSEVLDYFDKLKYWGMTPESGWFNSLDEGIDVLTEMNKEMLVGNIYPFMELIISMPKGVRESYLKIRPMLMKFPYVGFDKTKEELEMYEQESYEKLNGLMVKYASLVGEEAKTVEKLQNKYDSLKTKMVSGLSGEEREK